MSVVCVDSREASGGGESGEGRLASFPRRYHYRMLKHLQVCAWCLLYAVLGDSVGLEGQDKVIGDGVGLEGQDEVIGDGVGLEGQDEVLGDGVGLEGQDKVIDIL